MLDAFKAYFGADKKFEEEEFNPKEIEDKKMMKLKFIGFTF